MDKVSIKFQIFTNLCATTAPLTAAEIRETTESMFTYITDGVGIKNPTDNVTNLHEVH